MRRNTRPDRKSSGLPMLSCAIGNVPGARSNFTSLVALYVPLPVVAPFGSNVVQVPPPVTSSGSSGLKVPEPLRVIFEQAGGAGVQSLALADALPPAELVDVPKLTLIMSHRNLVSSRSPFAKTVKISGDIVNIAPAKTQRRLILITPSLAILSWFIVPLPSCCCMTTESRKWKGPWAVQTQVSCR